MIEEEYFLPTNPEIESLSSAEIIFVVILPAIMTVVLLFLLR